MCYVTISYCYNNNNNNIFFKINKNKTLFIDFKKIDYLQIQEYEILKYIPYVHTFALIQDMVVA